MYLFSLDVIFHVNFSYIFGKIISINIKMNIFHMSRVSFQIKNYLDYKLQKSNHYLGF